MRDVDLTPAAPLPHPRVVDAVTRAVDSHRGERGPLLNVLNTLVADLGHVPVEAIRLVAERLNLSRAEVHGVVSFYKDLRTEAPGRRLVQVCRAEACQSVGAERLVRDVSERLGVGLEQTRPDGSITLEEVFCLGNCALGPSALVDGRLYGRLTADRLCAVAETQDVAEPQDAVEAPATPNELRILFVPCDSAARSLGADQVADALARPGAAAGLTLVRNGSWGLFWLEPLVEVMDADHVRHAFGPITPDDVPGLIEAGALTDPAGCDHPLALGPTERISAIEAQNRISFARVGVIGPVFPEHYLAHGGMTGLRRALTMTPADVVQEVTDSGLRGRGGAGFPTGVKWKTVAEARSDLKFICVNADEGDSGTFADRMLMEGDPFSTLEGMAITAHAVGATEGYIYIRSEYPDAVLTMRRAIDVARARGWLGDGILGSDLSLDVQVRVGAGAYICGEETSMLNSLEGRRGEVRAKPPLPAVEGLFGRPTVVNNLLTIATLPAILAGGAQAYAELGIGRSRGTQVVQLAGNVARGGIVEVPFGIPIVDLVHDWGGGTASGRPVGAVQVGGPLGAYLGPGDLDVPMAYEEVAAAGGMAGHGGVVVFDDTVDLLAQARFAMEFCSAESCGKCTPCRIGSTRGVEVIDAVGAATASRNRRDQDANLVVLEDLCELLADGSLCAMGGLTPMPVRSAVRLWRAAGGAAG